MKDIITALALCHNVTPVKVVSDEDVASDGAAKSLKLRENDDREVLSDHE